MSVWLCEYDCHCVAAIVCSLLMLCGGPFLRSSVWLIMRFSCVALCMSVMVHVYVLV